MTTAAPREQDMSFPSHTTLAKHQQVAQSVTKEFPNLLLMEQTAQLIAMLTIIRNKNTPQDEFVFYSNRVIRLLLEHALNALPFEPLDVETPTQEVYQGLKFTQKICGVSIVRAGESMEAALREVCKACRIGKILIQRDEETHLPKLFWEKLPCDINERSVLLLEPMLASGGSAIQAVNVLKNAGVPEERIIMVHLVAAPEGLQAISEAHPNVKIACAAVDEKLNENKYILPGVGDFGDRYFGTD